MGDHEMTLGAWYDLNINSAPVLARPPAPVIPLPLKERRLRFAFQPLTVPHVVRSSAEGVVTLYVRFSAQVPGTDTVAVPPMLESEVALELRAARRDGHAVERVLVVGADPLFGRADGPLGDPSKAHGWANAVEALASLFDKLRAEGVPFVWRTRGGLTGSIPAALSRALLDAGPLATLEVGIPTLDRTLCTELEGGQGALPEDRLRLASAASARGVAVRALIEPMVPMLTDQRAALEPLFQALADAGVHRAGVRYLVLTQERARGMSRRLSKMHRALVQGIFADQPWIAAEPGASDKGPHKLLPPALRQKGHQRASDAAARAGVVVDVLDPVERTELISPPDGTEGEETAPKSRRRGRRRSRSGARPQLDLFRVRS
jgi:hypothetical protein